MCRIAFAFLALLLASHAQAQLRGHGGAVRALAISADGKTAISGSFDSSAIIWALPRNAAEQVLRFHESAVNAVALLPDGRVVTGGADGRIALWWPGEPAPERVLEGHVAPVASLAVSPDGATLASASWDRTARLWPLHGGTPSVLEGHQQNINGVAFTPDGKALVTAAYDLTLRIWTLADFSAPVDRPSNAPAESKSDSPVVERARGTPAVVTVPTPLNAVAVSRDGEIVAGGADGRVYFLSSAGEPRGEIDSGQVPIVTVAVSGDGALIAAAGIRGSVAIIGRRERKVLRTLVGPGLPVWSAVFFPDNHTLLTGGTDRTIRRWDALTGDHIGEVTMAGASDPLAAYADDRGAQVFRACIACHTLGPDEGNRAGPSLHGVFGRRIATLPGYNFSPALKKLDIVWTPTTVARLFEIGPSTYTPGTKMPEQTIGSADDRAALVKFLEKATK